MSWGAFGAALGGGLETWQRGQAVDEERKRYTAEQQRQQELLKRAISREKLDDDRWAVQHMLNTLRPNAELSADQAGLFTNVGLGAMVRPEEQVALGGRQVDQLTGMPSAQRQPDVTTKTGKLQFTGTAQQLDAERERQAADALRRLQGEATQVSIDQGRFNLQDAQTQRANQEKFEQWVAQHPDTPPLEILRQASALGVKPPDWAQAQLNHANAREIAGIYTAPRNDAQTQTEAEFIRERLQAAERAGLPFGPAEIVAAREQYQMLQGTVAPKNYGANPEALKAEVDGLVKAYGSPTNALKILNDPTTRKVLAAQGYTDQDLNFVTQALQVPPPAAGPGMLSRLEQFLAPMGRMGTPGQPGQGVSFAPEPPAAPRQMRISPTASAPQGLVPMEPGSVYGSTTPPLFPNTPEGNAARVRYLQGLAQSRLGVQPR